jgi:hypothetical protein
MYKKNYDLYVLPIPRWRPYIALHQEGRNWISPNQFTPLGRVYLKSGVTDFPNLMVFFRPGHSSGA